MMKSGLLTLAALQRPIRSIPAFSTPTPDSGQFYQHRGALLAPLRDLTATQPQHPFAVQKILSFQPPRRTQIMGKLCKYTSWEHQSNPRLFIDQHINIAAQLATPNRRKR
jgi:hypothetical protein